MPVGPAAGPETRACLAGGCISWLSTSVVRARAGVLWFTHGFTCERADSRPLSASVGPLLQVKVRGPGSTTGSTHWRVQRSSADVRRHRIAAIMIGGRAKRLLLVASVVLHERFSSRSARFHSITIRSSAAGASGHPERRCSSPGPTLVGLPEPTVALSVAGVSGDGLVTATAGIPAQFTIGAASGAEWLVEASDSTRVC